MISILPLVISKDPVEANLDRILAQAAPSLTELCHDWVQIGECIYILGGFALVENIHYSCIRLSSHVTLHVTFSSGKNHHSGRKYTPDEQRDIDELDRSRTLGS